MVWVQEERHKGPFVYLIQHIGMGTVHLVWVQEDTGERPFVAFIITLSIQKKRNETKKRKKKKKSLVQINVNL